MVVLEGWPSDLPHNPKTISKARLELLHAQLTTGTIFYRKMIDNELEEHIAKYQAATAASS
jgi:hypothetical protein